MALGPASMSMVVAAQRYLAWLTSPLKSAAQCGYTGMASAAAFEAAFAMTVSARRRSLPTGSARGTGGDQRRLGQNTPAIMATEHCGEMWAQDALACTVYATSSAAAGG